MASVANSVRVVSAEICRGDRYLITQRGAKAVLPLLWEFPGGRVRDEEGDAGALRRCLRDRIGVDASAGARLLEDELSYPDWTVTLVVYRCDIGAEEPWPAKVAAVAWVTLDELSSYPFPGADQRTLEQLLRGEAG